MLRLIKCSGRGLSQEQAEELADLVDLDHQDDIREAFSTDWLVEIIDKSKVYKSPGVDGIPNEFYYLLRHNEHLIGLLKACFKHSLKTGILPVTMRRTYYRLLYKKGSFTSEQITTGELNNTPEDPANLGNWRPIGLLNCDYKLFAAYLQQSLVPFMDALVSKHQTAFIPGRSIHENIMLIQMLIHKHMTEKKPYRSPIC